MWITWLACVSPPPEDSPTPSELPQVGPAEVVVPGPGLPPEVAPQAANNNLDVAAHDGKIYLAFRSAPTHFASDQAELWVVSSADHQSWDFEARFSLGTDLREPQLVSWEGQLRLFFAQLGTNPAAFEPQGSWVSKQVSPGVWTEPEPFGDPSLIPWRIKPLAGRLSLTGYVGGENVYVAGGDPIRIQWLASDDARAFEPWVEGQAVVLEGGGSESDVVLVADGSLLAVVRNEAGDDEGFGSKVCTAPADDPGAWSCSADRRKYDSPLLFERNGRYFLIARRQVANDGNYDLGQSHPDLASAYLAYQAAWWSTPKRCALWEVFPKAQRVEHLLDLTGRGDTCFPEILEHQGELWVYNYTNDPDGPDLPWYQGQLSPTWVVRQTLGFDEDG